MKILFVDDEEHVVRGVSRMISCEKEDWEVATALSGEAALEILGQDDFNVVVSDMRMPGMDGAQLLEKIEQQYPSMLRIVLSGQADRETVLRAVKPMHQYLSKPCSPDKLVEVIARAEIFQETIHSPELLDVIGQAGGLPSFPEVVNEIDREVNSQGSTSFSIAEIASKDPVLSARILQLSNSAIFGIQDDIVDLDCAITVVGIDMLRSLVMSQVVFSGCESNNQILSTKCLFDHGILVASIGKKLAKYTKASTEDSNIVFTAGLLHDVGKLILLSAFSEKYETILASAKLDGPSIQQLEMETFGATHQGIGGYLFELWGLPAGVIEAVASHHSFTACAHAVGAPRQLVFAANWIAGDRTLEELDEYLAEADDNGEAEKFARQIAEWQKHIADLDEEG